MIIIYIIYIYITDDYYKILKLKFVHHKRYTIITEKKIQRTALFSKLITVFVVQQCAYSVVSITDFSVKLWSFWPWQSRGQQWCRACCIICIIKLKLTKTPMIANQLLKMCAKLKYRFLWHCATWPGGGRKRVGWAQMLPIDLKVGGTRISIGGKLTADCC